MRNIAKEVKRALNERMKYLTEIRYGYESHTAVSDSNYDIDVQYVDIDKMIDYYNKKSKPERLVKSISDRRKLLARWAIAVMMGWHECADVFEAEIRNRRLLTTNSLAGAKASMEQKTTMFQKNWGWHMKK
jgi:hypothetical protein